MNLERYVLIKKGILMKKQSMILAGLLIAASALQGATVPEIQTFISKWDGNGVFDAIAFSKGTSTTPLDTWNAGFVQAKTFVIDNSKNLVGMKDSDLTNAMAGVEKGNMDLINTIKVIRAVSSPNDLQKQINTLQTIKNNINNAIIKLNKATMTLENKKNAKTVVLALAAFLEKTINRINGKVLEKMRSSAPTDLPPVYVGN
jgi:hypothetical protein